MTCTATITIRKARFVHIFMNTEKVRVEDTPEARAEAVDRARYWGSTIRDDDPVEAWGLWANGELIDLYVSAEAAERAARQHVGAAIHVMPQE